MGVRREVKPGWVYTQAGSAKHGLREWWLQHGGLMFQMSQKVGGGELVVWRFLQACRSMFRWVWCGMVGSDHMACMLAVCYF